MIKVQGGLNDGTIPFYKRDKVAADQTLSCSSQVGVFQKQSYSFGENFDYHIHTYFSL